MKIQDWMAKGQWEWADRHWYLRFRLSSPHCNLAARFSVIYLQPGNYHLGRRVPVGPLAKGGRCNLQQDIDGRRASPSRPACQLAPTGRATRRKTGHRELTFRGPMIFLARPPEAA